MARRGTTTTWPLLADGSTSRSRSPTTPTSGCAVVGANFEFVAALGTGCRNRGSLRASSCRTWSCRTLRPVMAGISTTTWAIPPKRSAEGMAQTGREGDANLPDKVLVYDKIYVGGNAKHQSSVDLGPKAKIVNTAGILRRYPHLGPRSNSPVGPALFRPRKVRRRCWAVLTSGSANNVALDLRAPASQTSRRCIAK